MAATTCSHRSFLQGTLPQSQAELDQSGWGLGGRLEGWGAGAQRPLGSPRHPHRQAGVFSTSPPRIGHLSLLRNRFSSLRQHVSVTSVSVGPESGHKRDGSSAQPQGAGEVLGHCTFWTWGPSRAAMAVGRLASSLRPRAPAGCQPGLPSALRGRLRARSCGPLTGQQQGS